MNNRRPTLLAQIKAEHPEFSTDHPELDEVWPLVESSYQAYITEQVRESEEKIGVISFAIGALVGAVATAWIMKREL